MKKLGLLAMTFIVPSFLVGCKSEVPIIEQQMSKEGLALAGFVKTNGVKENLQGGPKWEQLWSTARNRPTTFLEDSWLDEFNKAKEELPEITDANCKLYDYEYAWETGEEKGTFKTYYFANENYERVIFYLHGGAYFNNIAANHIKTCYAISKKFNAKVYMPIYPVIPNHMYHDYRMCYAFIENLYKHAVQEESDKDKDFIFMGDSAGGGLTLGFTQYLAKELPDVKLPVARVCFSPWCDITLYNNNEEATKKDEVDIFLSLFGLRKFGVEWAGISTTIIDYRLSPVFGDLNDGIDTIIFNGTDEIFYPDSLETAQKLFKNGVRTKFVKGNGLFHVYPIFYGLPEANEAIQIAYDFVVEHK